MAQKEIKNTPASVKARLMNIAINSGTEFQNIFLQFVQERFLYRLSKSKYKSKFILKGALLFLAFNISRLRPTRDIDFLGNRLSNNAEVIKKIVNDILQIQCNDGLKFDNKSIEVTEIIDRGNYKGLRVKFFVFLENARIKMQVDISYGDKIVAGPVSIDYPVLLDFPTPKLKAYSIESAIAEKFEAIVSINFLSSRMKDFYDIWFFASNYEFSSSTLRAAIITTFNKRETSIENRSQIYSEEFTKSANRQTMWKAYLTKNKLESINIFPELIDKLKLFIEPVLKSGDNLKWIPKSWKWE